MSRKIRMTPALRETYDAIEAFTLQHGYSPSYRQLGDILHLESSSTVYDRLHALKSMGLVDFEPSSPRTLRILKTCALPPNGEVA